MNATPLVVLVLSAASVYFLVMRTLTIHRFKRSIAQFVEEEQFDKALRQVRAVKESKRRFFFLMPYSLFLHLNMAIVNAQADAVARRVLGEASRLLEDIEEEPQNGSSER